MTQRYGGVVSAPAKLNLTLHVTARRPDGYHELDSLVVFAALGDRLSLAQASGAPALRCVGPHGDDVPAGDDNLVLRAARLIGARDVAITLDKRLPVASGMGGGSSDAAATLKLLAQAQGLSLPDTQVLMGLGADLPVCLQAPHPCRMQGLGERLSPVVDLPALALVIVNPGVPLSTPAVFKALESPENPPMPATLPAWADQGELCDWLGGMRNDLQDPACTLVPQIGEVLDAIARQPGCLLARMTGSGATCFGIFADSARANDARAALARPGWFCAETQTAHRAT
ncbi:MAG: 4-diphosphocytidyl-2-C-methyl-D-erythritol kinase IspE [Rhodobacteraceae bacterium HLUCCA12]|nr:MAG: 4-diphosphocytidyl-2-C-methyl-D-erythritol kinase IspE [Rhodobacteraceae bacterium HLUCCA12]